MKATVEEGGDRSARINPLQKNSKKPEGERPAPERSRTQVPAWQSMYRHAAARGFSPAACRTPLEVWNHPRRFSYLTVEFLLETDSGYPRDAAFFCH